MKEKLKMIVVSAEADVAQNLERGFMGAGILSLGCAYTAAEAMRLVEEQKPDLLVMEPYLPGMNCDELTDLLEQAASPLLVKLVVSSRKQDLLASRFSAVGGDLFRLQPIDYMYTAMQIRKRIEERCRNFYAMDEEGGDRIREALESLLHWFGMPRTLKGFAQIREGAILAMQDPSLLEDMKNRFYPMVAAQLQTAGYCVERCIRTAIEKTCAKGDPERIFHYFSPGAENGSISNKEFVAQIIALYRKDLKNIER